MRISPTSVDRKRSTTAFPKEPVPPVINRILFLNNIKAKAVAEVEKEFEDLIDDEVFDGVEFDDDDVERVRILDDGDEVVIDDIDFEDFDADVVVQVKFEQDDIKYKAYVNVEIKDGDVEDSDLDYVEYRD